MGKTRFGHLEAVWTARRQVRRMQRQYNDVLLKGSPAMCESRGLERRGARTKRESLGEGEGEGVGGERHVRATISRHGATITHVPP